MIIQQQSPLPESNFAILVGRRGCRSEMFPTVRSWGPTTPFKARGAVATEPWEADDAKAGENHVPIRLLRC